MHRSSDDYRKTLVGIIAIGVLLVSVVGWRLYDSYEMAWSHAVGTSSNLTIALQRDIGRTIDTLDLGLKAVLRGLGAKELPQLSRQTRHALLFDGALEAKHIGSMFVMDRDGHIVDDSGALTPRAGSFADRDYFRVHQERSDVGLYISKPNRSRVTDQWSIALSRRINDAAGEFAGVVVGSIHFSYFADLFANLALGPDGSISLFHTDGTMLYRVPFVASHIGQNFGTASVFQAVRAERTLSYESVAQIDGQSKLFTVAVVDGLPLLLSVNVATHVIYADWYVKAALTCGITIVLLAMGGLLVRSARFQQLQRLQVEQDTARSSQLLKAYFDHSSDALFALDVAPDGRLTYERYNRAFGILTGIADDRAIGKDPREVFGPELGQELEEHARSCLQSGHPYSYQETRMLPNGRRDWHAVLCPVSNASGLITLLLGSARDMTEANRREAELHQASKMEAVGRLTAGVAHDFNNYLQTITGSVEVLTTDYLSQPEAIEYGELARRAAERGARLTHRLLAFSRQQVLQPQRVNVATLLGETRRLAGSAAFGIDIEFKIVVESFTDDINVDFAQAESCLLNLLFNARDAMPEGGRLVLHARNAQPTDGRCGTTPPENVVIIAVHDSGSGMDATTKARAFEPFFTTKAFGKGSGLGLSMVQGFCHQSGGDVRIVTESVVGTRVELWLPAATATSGAGEEINFNLASLGRTTGRILLVEDEHDVATALADTLVSGGFEVVAVSTGRDGLARLKDRDPYDAVLTDYAMPDMTGAEFLTLVAARRSWLPMLMISGYDLIAADLPEVLRSIPLLRKPIRRPELLAAVRDAIAETRSIQAA